MIPGSSTATDNFAGSIRPEGQSRQVNLISLHLYNNAATIFFHYSQYTSSPTNKYTLWLQV